MGEQVSRFTIDVTKTGARKAITSFGWFPTNWSHVHIPAEVHSMSIDSRFSFFPVAIDGDVVAELALPIESSDPVVKAYQQGQFLNQYLMPLLNTFTKPGDYVLDLGCHVGTLSVPASVLGRHVAAVDASRLHVDAIRASIEQNRLGNLQVTYCAIGEVDGDVGFHENGIWGMVSRDSGDTSGQRVPAKRVDSLLSELGWPRIDLVKMDVEGSELHALRSMHGFLLRPDAPAIIYESNGMTFELFGYSITDIRNFLEEHGYQTYRVEGQRFVYCPPAELQPEAWLDVVALPAQWREQLRARLSTAWSEAEMIDRCLEWGNSEHPNVRQYLFAAMTSESTYPRHDARLKELFVRLGQESSDAA
jgi:FkbM family methyltransferase